MNLLKISWSNIRHKPANTLLSIILLAFGVGIISLMLIMKKQISENFDRNIRDIDFVLAAKGSPLQSILANVYHVDAPTGNIKVSEAAPIIRNIMVKDAIPLAYGDNYEKWRIVGTNEKYPAHYGCSVGEGKLFSAPFEATIGSEVARLTNLKIGDTFTSAHGFDHAAEGDADAHHHDKPYTIVGIFNRSGSVIDNLILTPVESTWMVHDHSNEPQAELSAPETMEPANDDHETHVHSDTLPEENLTGDQVMQRMAQSGGMIMPRREGPDREMTAYLIIKKNKGAFGMLSRMTENTTMQLANVAVENNRLLNNFSIGMSIIMGIAILISVISFISIFISLYNSLKERRYELALMRTMGGTRIKLFSLILFEGIVLVVLGYVAGMLLSRIGLLVIGSFVRDSYHYSISDLGITLNEVILLLVTLAVGILASLLPAVRALKMDISETLANG